ncbi:MAG: NADP-dependent isocitrate dehydrogenase [Planctomycetota bacterium]
MSEKTPITVAMGDGIGPEIMPVALHVLEAGGAQLELNEVEIGREVYLRGITSGVGPGVWESLRDTRVFYKAPITTPQGGGYKSLNVTMRKTLGLYANVRPCVSYHPFVPTKHPKMNVVIIRENEEDTYAGIEHQQTDEVVQCLKLISRPGCERIVRYVFEYAVENNRRKVTCFTKDNIMKLTDGLFHRVFDEVGEEYPDIEKEHWIIDIGTARLANDPQRFDVIVTPNLYGDIISDVAAEITGSVGLAGSANIGNNVAMFEAIHGSAPDIAGKNMANPSGLILAGVMMLVHLGQREQAEVIHNAWLRTIEEGIFTADLHRPDSKGEPVGTDAFGKAVVERLGKTPETLPTVSYAAGEKKQSPGLKLTPTTPKKKAMVGVDVFLHWRGGSPDDLGNALSNVNGDGLALKMITNRGVKVWPEGHPETFCTDHWRCRFNAATDSGTVQHAHIMRLLERVANAGLDFIKIETLCTFDGDRSYSLGQGE